MRRTDHSAWAPRWTVQRRASTAAVYGFACRSRWLSMTARCHQAAAPSSAAEFDAIRVINMWLLVVAVTVLGGTFRVGGR